MEETAKRILALKAEVYDLLVKKDSHSVAIQQIDQLKSQKIQEINELESKLAIEPTGPNTNKQ